MGLFGKSDKEKERDDVARQQEARRKMEAARRQQQPAPQAAPARPVAPPAATAAPKPVAPPTGGQNVPAASTAGQADGETYTVVKGDSLSKIAKAHLGDGNDWRRIYEANREVIGSDPDKIRPGQKLRLPKRTVGRSPQTA